MKNILESYLRWATGKQVPWYEFWNPQSGLFGGFVMACGISVIVHLIFACLQALK